MSRITHIPEGTLFKVYRLLDPFTKEVRYIGVSVRDLNDRLKDHINQAKSRRHDCAKCTWIRDLGDVPPIVEIIETCEKERSFKRERYWIYHYTSNGANLTNTTTGGDGVSDYEHPPEVREHLSEVAKKQYDGWSPDKQEAFRKINKGRIHTLEARAHMAEAARNRKKKKNAS
jgi:hypothetical protein